MGQNLHPTAIQDTRIQRRMRQTLTPGPEDLENKLTAKEIGIWAPEHLETILSLDLKVERKGLKEAFRTSDDILQEYWTLSGG